MYLYPTFSRILIILEYLTLLRDYRGLSLIRGIFVLVEICTFIFIYLRYPFDRTA